MAPRWPNSRRWPQDGPKVAPRWLLIDPIPVSNLPRETVMTRRRRTKIDFGNEKGRRELKRSQRGIFERGCRKRDDIAQKMARGCPNLMPKHGRHHNDFGARELDDGTGRGSKNRREERKQQLKNKYFLCVVVAQKWAVQRGSCGDKVRNTR